MANPFQTVKQIATVTNTATSIDMGADVGSYSAINLGPPNVAAGVVVPDLWLNDSGGTAVASDATANQIRLPFRVPVSIPKTTTKVFSAITASGSTTIQIIGTPETQT